MSNTPIILGVYDSILILDTCGSELKLDIYGWGLFEVWFSDRALTEANVMTLFTAVSYAFS